MKTTTTQSDAYTRMNSFSPSSFFFICFAPCNAIRATTKIPPPLRLYAYILFLPRRLFFLARLILRGFVDSVFVDGWWRDGVEGINERYGKFGGKSSFGVGGEVGRQRRVMERVFGFTLLDAPSVLTVPFDF